MVALGEQETHPDALYASFHLLWCQISN